MTFPAQFSWRQRISSTARLIGRWLPAVALLALLALVWQLVALHNGFVIPRLGAVWQQLNNHPREFIDGSIETLREAAVGLGASFVVAFTLAIAMSHVRVIERAVMPLAVILNVTPVVALAPGLAVAFGFGLTPRYLVTSVIVFFPMLVNSLVGLRSVDPEALDYFRTLDASRSELLVHLRLPSSLPYLFAAARISFPLAIIGAVVAEFSTATGGSTAPSLGSIISTASSYAVLPQLYAAVVCLALLGIAFTVVVAAIEHRVLSWQPSRASGSGSRLRPA